MRERQRHRQREKQTPCREPDVGLDPESPGSRPGLKAVLNCWTTGAAQYIKYFKFFVFFLIFTSVEYKINMHFSLFDFFFFFKNLRERECVHMLRMGPGAEGERERISSRFRTDHRAQSWAQFHDPKIMTRAETKSWMLNRLSHPGTPSLFVCFFFFPSLIFKIRFPFLRKTIGGLNIPLPLLFLV